MYGNHLKRKKNSKFKPVEFHLKIDFVSDPVYMEGVGKCIELDLNLLLLSSVINILSFILYAQMPSLALDWF